MWDPGDQATSVGTIASSLPFDRIFDGAFAMERRDLVNQLVLVLRRPSMSPCKRAQTSSGEAKAIFEVMMRQMIAREYAG